MKERCGATLRARHATGFQLPAPGVGFAGADGSGTLVNAAVSAAPREGTNSRA